MGIEIERKFLLANEGWRSGVVQSRRMRQGYLVDAAAFERGLARCSVRVRIGGEQAWINIKSAQLGVERAEYEYPLPLAEAGEMLDRLCTGQVEKIRHYVPVQESTFEIDEFLGDNAGLVVAELELASSDAHVPRPAWLGREVSHLPRYYNVHLIAHPYALWNALEREGEEEA